MRSDSTTEHKKCPVSFKWSLGPKSKPYGGHRDNLTYIYCLRSVRVGPPWVLGCYCLVLDLNMFFRYKRVQIRLKNSVGDFLT